MPIDLQPITDPAWLAIQGATPWPDGSRPLIAAGFLPDDIKVWVLVISPEGASFIPDDEHLEEGGYVLAKSFSSADEARVWVAKNIPAEPRNRLDFLQAGFE